MADQQSTLVCFNQNSTRNFSFKNCSSRSTLAGGIAGPGDCNNGLGFGVFFFFSLKEKNAAEIQRKKRKQKWHTFASHPMDLNADLSLS